MFRKLMGACVGLAMMGMAGMANATVIVNSSTSAFFQYDVAGIGSFDATGFFYSCFAPACPAGPDPDKLASGASFQMDFGSTLGANDLGTGFVFNSFAFEITNLSSSLRDAPGSGTSITINIDASLSNFFVTVLFVDDAFGIDVLNIGTSSVGTLVGEMVAAPAPEPSTLALFATGLALLAFLGWRRRGAVQVKAA